MTPLRSRLMCSRIAAVVVLLTALAGCSNQTAAPQSATPARTTSTAAQRLPPVSPDGFGAKPPTVEQISEYEVWKTNAGRIINDTTAALGQMNASVGVGPVVSACQNVAEILTIRLPAALPSPDEDLTNILTNFVQDGRDLAAACAAVGKTNGSSGSIAAMNEARAQLSRDAITASNIMARDEDLIAKHQTN